MSGDGSGFLGCRKPIGLECGFLLSSRTSPGKKIEGLAFSFLLFIIKHVIRTTNSLSHLCAKLACTLETTSYWIGTPPSFLTSSIFADCEGGVV
jgi:hypothetical protein